MASRPCTCTHGSVWHTVPGGCEYAGCGCAGFVETVSDYDRGYHAGQEEMRERCAYVCAELQYPQYDSDTLPVAVHHYTRMRCADAIRDMDVRKGQKGNDV